MHISMTICSTCHIALARSCNCLCPNIKPRTHMLHMMKQSAITCIRAFQMLLTALPKCPWSSQRLLPCLQPNARHFAYSYRPPGMPVMLPTEIACFGAGCICQSLSSMVDRQCSVCHCVRCMCQSLCSMLGGKRTTALQQHMQHSFCGSLGQTPCVMMYPKQEDIHHKVRCSGI